MTKVEIRYHDGKKNKSFECNALGTMWCILPFEQKTKDDSQTEANILVSCSDTSCNSQVLLLDGSSLIYNSTQGYIDMVLPGNSAELTIQAFTSDILPENAKPEDYKLLISSRAGNSDTYLPGYFVGNSLLKMDILQKLAGEPISKAKPVGRETTELGSVVVCTLYPTDAGYCASDSCSFVVKLKMENIQYLNFNVEAQQIIMPVNMKTAWGGFNHLVLQGQTFKDKPAIYRLDLDSPGDMSFELISAEGNPDIYINVDESLDFDISKYHFKSENNGFETVFVGKADIMEGSQQGKAVFIVISSHQTSGFGLSVTWNEYNDYGHSFPIRLNSFYSGELQDHEVKSFVLSYKPQVPEIVSGYAILKTSKGNPDLFIKDCTDLDRCYFTLDEINEGIKKKTLNPNSEDFFIYSDNPVESDRLFFELMVMPPGETYKLPDESVIDQPSKSSRKTYVSANNKICIGVLGNSNAFSEISQYSLTVQGKGSHKVVKEYQTEYLFLYQNDMAFFVYKPLNLPEQAKGIEIKFEITSGDVNFYYSRINRYPNKENNEAAVDIDNSQVFAETIFKRMKIAKEDLRNEGIYFGFEAVKSCMVKLEVVYWLTDGRHLGYIELIPDTPVVRHLKDAKDFMDESKQTDTFAFNKTDPKSHVFLSLTTLYSTVYNELQFCAALQTQQDKKPTFSDCKREGAGGFIEIDAGESSIGTWFVFVKRVEVQESREVFKASYQISLMGSGSVHRIKKRGVPEEFMLPAGMKAGGTLHFIEFVSDRADGSFYLVGESLNQQDFYLDMTFNKSEVFNNDGRLGFGRITESSNLFTIEFNESTIRDLCKPMTIEDSAHIRLEQGTDEYETSKPQVETKSSSDFKTPGELYMPLLCTGYISVRSSYKHQGESLPYRLLFTKAGDKLELQTGVSYMIPVPGTVPAAIKTPVTSLPNGAAISVSRLYEPIQLEASVVSINTRDKHDVYNSSLAITGGLGATTLEIVDSIFDNMKLKEASRVNFIDFRMTVNHNADLAEFTKPESSKRPIVAGEYFKVTVTTSMSKIELGEPVTGRVSQGNTRYYSLEVDGAVNLTMTLQTKGNQDADLFVKVPGKADFLARSSNIKSDEVYIAGNPAARGKRQTYTIGVQGFTDTCEFVLTVLNDAFKILTPDLSTIYTFKISERSPLVLRSDWHNLAGIRIFYYSFDSVIMVKAGRDDGKGLIQAVNALETKEAIDVNDVLSKAKNINLKKADQLDEAQGQFLAFYPESSEGSVQVVVVHPMIPIRLKAEDGQLRIVLGRSETIRVKPYVPEGELSEIEIQVATTGAIEFQYDSE